MSDCFDFQDHFVETNEIRLINLLQLFATIMKFQNRLSDDLDLPVCKLDGETLLINRLQKTAALVFIDFKAGTKNGMRLLT